MAHQDIIKMLEQEWRDRLEAAVKQEREACAKICERIDESWRKAGFCNQLEYKECANAIRARGQQQ